MVLTDSDFNNKLMSYQSDDNKVWISSCEILPFKLKTSVFKKIDRLSDEEQESIKEKCGKDIDITKLEYMYHTDTLNVDNIIKECFWLDTQDEFRDKYNMLSLPFSLGSLKVINKTFGKKDGSKTVKKSNVLSQVEQYNKSKITPVGPIPVEPSAIPVEPTVETVSNSFEVLAVDSDED